MSMIETGKRRFPGRRGDLEPGGDRGATTASDDVVPEAGPPQAGSFGGGRGTDYEWDGRDSYRPEKVDEAAPEGQQERLRPAYGARHDPPLSKGHDSDNNPPAQGPIREEWDWDDAREP